MTPSWCRRQTCSTPVGCGSAIRAGSIALASRSSAWAAWTCRPRGSWANWRTNSSVRTTALGCIGAGAGRQVAAGVLGQGGEQLLGGAEVLADRGVVLAALAGGGVVEHGLVLGLGGPGALVVHGPTVPRGCGAAPGAAGGRPVGHRLLLLHRVVRTASVMVPVASAIVTCTRSSISRGE